MEPICGRAKHSGDDVGLRGPVGEVAPISWTGKRENLRSWTALIDPDLPLRRS